MIKQYINRDWNFIELFTESMTGTPMSGGEKVDLPHTVCETPFNYFDENDYQMISCYQRKLYADPAWDGQCVYLTFEGVAHKADVYVNGLHVAEHKCGYTAFTVDLTGRLLSGEENLITVRVDSREDLDQPPFGFVIDYMTYGGIYRDVYVTVKDPVHMSEVFYQPRCVTPPRTRGMKLNDLKEYRVAAQVSTTMELSPDAKRLAADHKMNVRQYLEKEDGSDRREISMQPLSKDGWTSTLAGDVAIWDINSPERYRITTELLVEGKVRDRHSELIGFREFLFRKEGFFLNGRKIKLRGLNRHQSYPYVGYAMPESMQREDARICKEELGLNAVRTSHYPQSHYFIDECDRLGLLVFTEIPGWQHIGGSDWQDIAVKNVRDMVMQYRNHPSIMLWGVRINESPDDDVFYRRTNDVAHELDPTRLTGGVRCHTKMSLLEDVYTYNDFSFDGTNEGCQPMAKVTPDVEKPYLISEYNGHMYPTKTFDDEEQRQKHAIRHATVINAVAGQDDIAGAFGWCMFDYNTHKDFGSGDRICYHGVMDMFRNPKIAAAVYAAQSDKEPVLEVTSSMDIGEHPASVRGETYIISNADSVRMYKNDVFIKEYTPDMSEFKNLRHGPVAIDDYIGDAMIDGEGFSERKNKLVKICLNETAIHGYKITPKIAAAALQLMLFHGLKISDATPLYEKYIGDWGGEARVYRFEAIRRGEVVKTITKGPVNSVYLTSTVSSHELTEGITYDVAEIRISACDEYGNVIPYFAEAVNVEAQGPIEIIGPRVIPLRGGMSGVYVKSKGVTGEAKIRLTAIGATPAEVSFVVKKLEPVRINSTAQTVE